MGRSLAFYTDIIGFEQIERPNLHRHGAWLTMGYLELNSIKGIPNAPSGRGELKKPFQERVEKALEGVEEAALLDGQLLEKIIGRQKTYCHICQGFSAQDLASAFCKSGNYAPTALLLLAACC